MKDKNHDCYIINVKNSIFSNLRMFIKHGEDKEYFLKYVIDYCQKLLADPKEPKEPRKRIRAGKRYYTKKR
jgi:hypothetical protein